MRAASKNPFFEIFARAFGPLPGGGKEVDFRPRPRNDLRYMILDDVQRKQVAEWIAQGCKLSDIQNRLNSELGLKMTYMEVRLLVDDLKLTPKDPEPPTPAPSIPGGSAPGNQASQPAAPEEAQESPSGGVSVSVDQLARPGTVASGKVTFSDGNKAMWYFDQTGRLGLSPEITGYRPNTADLQEFQMALEQELSRMGL